MNQTTESETPRVVVKSTPMFHIPNMWENLTTSGAIPAFKAGRMSDYVHHTTTLTYMMGVSHDLIAAAMFGRNGVTVEIDEDSVTIIGNTGSTFWLDPNGERNGSVLDQMRVTEKKAGMADTVAAWVQKNEVDFDKYYNDEDVFFKDVLEYFDGSDTYGQEYE